MRKWMIIGCLMVVAFGLNAKNRKDTSNNVVREWRDSENQLIVKGSFLLTKKGNVFVETKDRKVLSLAIKNLSWTDQRFVEIQIEKINAVVAQKPKPSIGSYILYGIYMLMGGSIVWMILRSRKKSVSKRKKYKSVAMFF